MLFFKKKQNLGIQVFNSAKRQKELFIPLKKGHVGMYTCGPTVYDEIHIGNLRAYIVADVVRRVFENAGYSVRHVMNFTDFGHLVSDGDDGEDKMTKGLKREGKALTMENMYALATTYINAFERDRAHMNILKPHVTPRASEHVPAQIAYVAALLDKGYAYKTSDGVYFDTEKFPAYGVLGGSASVEHSRTGVSTDKKNPRDFALWKFSEALGWNAPWGRGFPGWHTECTAMSTRYLGKSFDVHTGGIDLKPVHHNNEIAQAEVANSMPYARYWIHNEFVTVDESRIGKSLGNAITLRQLTAKGIHPLSYRYWVLGGHYRQHMNFSWESVVACHAALVRAWKLFATLKGSGAVPQTVRTRFEQAVCDDFNTPQVVALLWEVLKDQSLAPGEKRASVLLFDSVLGVGFDSVEQHLATVDATALSEHDIPPHVKTLVQAREAARLQKNYTQSDELRTSIEKEGFTVIDSPEGPVVKKAL